MRLDIDESSVDSLYVTVWASPYVPLHMGKKENAYKTLEDHFGCRLQVKLWFFLLYRIEMNFWIEHHLDYNVFLQNIIDMKRKHYL